MRRSTRSALPLMALTVFIDITGFGVILPLLPFWAQHLGASAVQVTLTLALYALAQFLFTPILGALSDRYGRRPIIIASLLIEAVSFALSALAATLPLLLIARFVGGLGAANLGSAQAVVADVTPPEGRARGMGLIGAAIGMGFVIGPALGGVLSGVAHDSVALPFWVAMGIALVNAILVLAFLPETHAPRAKTPQLRAPRFASPPRRRGGWVRALRTPAVARLVAINLLFTLAFVAMEAVFPLFTQATFHWNATQNGYVFFYVGIVIVLMQGGLVGRLVKRFGERAILISGLVLLAAGLLLLPFSSSLTVLLISLGVLSLGDGMVSPTSSALLSFAAPDDAQGETLGVAQGIASLGRIAGPLGAGVLFTIGIGLPFAIGGLVTLLAIPFALRRLPASRRPDAPLATPPTDAQPDDHNAATLAGALQS